jgi:SAM-dependent methyltransferase
VYEDSIRAEFTRQAQSFGSSAAMTSAQTLGALIDLVPEDADARWVDVACGPGVIARAMAGKVGSVSGVDLTPAMIEEARRRAGEEGIDNVSFALGDATALDLADVSFDGAITRLSLHHIPAPGRVVAEMARVVRPGGWVAVSDLAADRDGEAAAWREEIERLRDPSHWACRTPEGLRGMGAAAGLVVEREELVLVDIDFDDWLARGSGGRAAAALVARLLDEQPPGAESFRVVEGDAGRRLRQRYWLCRWRRPDQPTSSAALRPQLAEGEDHEGV